MIDASHLHPMLVHFPIALIAFGFLAEIASRLFKKEVCLSTVSFYLLIFGTLSAFAALITGALFTSEMSGTSGSIKETHEMFAWITVGTAMITSVFRIVLKMRSLEQTKLQWVAFVLYGLAALLVSITGFYGGTLVYNYMMPL